MKSLGQNLCKVCQYGSIILVGLVVCFLAFYNLENYPPMWFDEGLNLQPPKNLLLYGQYALRSSEGFRVFDPALQTGPTVLLPIALIFKLVGIGLFQARLVVVIYALLMLVSLYGVTAAIFDRRTALIAGLLLILVSDHEFLSFTFMSRQVLGEVPALFFLLSGTWLWFRAWEYPRWRLLLLSGALFGLAVVTKVQFALMIPAAAICLWLTDRLWVRKLSLHKVVLPMLAMGFLMLLWYGLQSCILGAERFASNVSVLREGSGIHILSFSPLSALPAIWRLRNSHLLILGLLGMIYTLSLGGRGWANLVVVFLVLFVLVWLGWYALFSIGWMRYAFVPVALCSIFAAKLIRDVTKMLPGDSETWRAASLTQRVRMILAGVVILIISLIVIGSGFSLAADVVGVSSNPAKQMAYYLDEHVPTDVVIESWEWELDLWTQHTYHHPATDITNPLTEHVWHGVPYSPEAYDFVSFSPSYLINGPFSKWTGIYTQDLLEREYPLVVSVGQYDLYKVDADEE